MSIAFFIGVIAIVIAYASNRMLYHLHMFQLNSYRLDRYGRFLSANIQKIVPLGTLALFLWIFILSIVYEFVDSAFALAISGLWATSILFRTYFLFFKGEKQKKPLVYTPRVKRILSVSAVLFALLFILIYRSNNVLLIANFLLMVSPIVILIANTLLMPFEAFMKSYYYNDAKKKLKDHKDLIVIGVTGSYGKTSVKFILEKILSQQFNTLVTPHSYNTTLGVVITIRKFLNRSHEVFVTEMGAKQKNDIKEICDLVEPEYGIITAVGPQHLETFGSLNTIIDTKFELAQAVKDKGICFVNGDSSNVLEGVRRYSDINYIKYGENEGSDLRISNVRQSIYGSGFTLTSKAGVHEYETKLLGMHNILNIAGAIGIAYQLGMTYDKIFVGVKEIKAVEHRLELKKQGDFIILDDAFNSNPSGAKFALDVLNQFDSGNKIIMTPGMIELGSMDHEIHFNFGQQISEVCDYVILIGENKTASIVKGLEASGYNMNQVFVMRNVYEGFKQIRAIAKKGDVILIENDLPDNFNE